MKTLREEGRKRSTERGDETPHKNPKEKPDD
jgi:hypothetical protein